MKQIINLGLVILVTSFLGCQNQEIENNNELTKSIKYNLIDSFELNDLYFYTLAIESEFEFKNELLPKGTYLSFKDGVSSNDSISFFDSLKSFYRIYDDYSTSEHFSSLSDDLKVNNPTILRYAYHGGGPIDIADNKILFVESEIKQEIYFTHWDYYYNNLVIKKNNDSTFSIIYTSRDRFGYFHDDYIVSFDRNDLTFEFIMPAEQNMDFSCLTMNNLVIYLSKKEAQNQFAISDSVLIDSGIRIDLDSIYWDLEVLKVYYNTEDFGFVNFEEINKSIDTNRAG